MKDHVAANIVLKKSGGKNIVGFGRSSRCIKIQ
jgi:hypothetical protein